MKQKMVLGYNIRKTVRIFFILLMGTLFWVGAIINQKHLADYHGSVSVRYREAVLTEQEIENVRENMILRKDDNIPEVTLWQSEENVLIQNDRIGTSLNLKQVSVVGNMTRVYPESILYGGYLFEEDYNGCVIDKNTAYKLFHTENAVGLKLNNNGKEYTVRGVIKPTIGNTMLIQVDNSQQKEGEIAKYSCMELNFPDTKNEVTLAKNFVAICGFDEPTAYIDGYLYQKIAERLIHIPLWFAGIWIIGLSIRRVYSLKASPVLSLSGGLIVIALIIILIKLTDFYIYYPNSLIPNRWSDFDFWSKQWKEMMISLRDRAGMIQYYKEIVLRRRFIYVLTGAVVAVIAEGYFLKGFCFGSISEKTS